MVTLTQQSTMRYVLYESKTTFVSLGIKHYILLQTECNIINISIIQPPQWAATFDLP